MGLIEAPAAAAPVRGWLLVLCGLLVIWGPFELALVLANALDALGTRGPALAVVIVVRLIVAAFGIAAGLSLAARRPGSVTMARMSLVCTAAVDTVVTLTSLFPSNRPPGDELLYAAGQLLYAAVWLLYLSRSRRVSTTFAA